MTSDSASLKICLVSPLCMSDFNEADRTVRGQHDPAPPLGILCVASSLIKAGHEISLINLDALFVDFMQTRRRNDSCSEFFPFAVNALETSGYNVFAFGSICSSYPLTLRLCEAVHRLHPTSRIVLGGPQASVVDEATMHAFPCIDFILRGEADESFPLLLSAVSNESSNASLAMIPGLTFRHEGGLVRNSTKAVISDLDSLPMPAYHLDPFIGTRKVINLEVGRGCPFSCTFCATSDFFRRNFRLKSSSRIIEEMRSISALYGVTNFSLVHDMFTGNRKKLQDFCQDISRQKESFTWTCSARTDCLDDELLALMAQSGCKGIFFGIETGSKRLQKKINKRLDLIQATARINFASRLGISTAVALITAFPDESRDDLRDTANYFIDATRFQCAEPQLSLLAPLAKTPLHKEYEDKLIWDHVYSDISHQGWRQDETDIAMIRAYPDIFPNFYSIPTTELPRQYFRDVRNFIVGLTSWFRWLPVALLQDGGDILTVFDLWTEWLEKNPVDKEALNGTPFHHHKSFADHFLSFLRFYAREHSGSPLALLTVANTEGYSLGKNPDGGFELSDKPQIQGKDQCQVEFELTAVPHRSNGLRMQYVDLDYKMLLSALRKGSGLKDVPQQEGMIGFQWIRDDRLLVRRLSPLSVRMLELCDGSRNIADILDASSDISIDGVSSTVSGAIIGRFALSRLLEQEMITISPGQESAI